MKKTRFSEEQIIRVLKEADGGLTIKEVCRRHGISPATFSNWRSKFGGVEGRCCTDENRGKVSQVKVNKQFQFSGQ